MPKTLKTRNRVPTFPHMNCRSDGRYVVGCVDHVHDEPLNVAVNPDEVLAVFHRVFQAWQCNLVSQGHRGVDVRPKKVPDEPVLDTSTRLELGEERASLDSRTLPTPKSLRSSSKVSKNRQWPMPSWAVTVGSSISGSSSTDV